MINHNDQFDINYRSYYTVGFTSHYKRDMTEISYYEKSEVDIVHDVHLILT